MLVFSDTLLPTHRVRHLCSPYATPSDATPSDNLQHQQCRLLREWQEAPVAGQPHPTSQPAGIQLAWRGRGIARTKVYSLYLFQIT